MSLFLKKRLRIVVIAAFAFGLGVLAAPRPAYALFDSGAIVAAIGALQGAMDSVIKATSSALNSSLGLINGSLGSGFTQLSNYMKAQVGAQEQISDANNLVQARLARDVRNAEQRDNHAVNRQDCLNLEGGQAAVVAARNGGDVAAALDKGKDLRAQAHKGTPAWEGAGQAAQAANNNHFSLYCSDAEADAGVCSLANEDQRDADQNVGSLLSTPVYTDKTAITRANDYATTLIQPFAPAALRGSNLTSIEGQAALPGRRSYNAAISLAQHVGDDIVGWHANTVTLSTAQKAEATREGIRNTDVGSEYEATELEINRKYSGTDWQADLQAMPSPKSVLIQIAMLDSQRNWLLWQQYKLDQQRALMEADRLAIEAEHRLRPVSPMPVPTTTLQ
ncbi:hypothetical protein GCM10010937_01070 [Gluconobacter japonicus]|uniref:TraW n=1 Tax=Gluconobacter japonicus TaxID=376620 RepID=A0ABQ5WFG3_GLUJA|nr:hypothetical protein AA3271_2695 [Gluconobacter japonicus NBRC 3271]GLQ58306.1 hypothetical protein GCM10010937_01070 [Gluconobacter japonicus]